MRSTVGPLPSAVYWRRRAVVLGALLLVVIVLFVSCGGSGDDDKKRGSGNGTAASQAPTPPAEDPSAEPEPSFTDARPGGPELPDPAQSGGAQSGGPQQPGTNPSGGAVTGNNANVQAPADGSCTDQEISAVPTPAAGTIKTGATLQIGFKIKNISTRVCTRDLGAGAQELYLDQGARKYWSSDTCDADRATNPVQMQPGQEYNYTRTWNGRSTIKCTGKDASGPALPPGHYQLRGRVGTKLSDPVAVDITA